MSAPDYIEYTITKTGANAYTMTWTPKLATYTNIQKNVVHLETEDVDGTKTVNDVEISPTSIATWNTNGRSTSELNALLNGNAVNGFKLVDTANLAPGGVCYEVDSVLEIMSGEPISSIG